MEVVKIVMIGITGVLLALFLKESKPEYSVYLSFAVGICILGYAVEKLSYLFESIKKIQEFLPQIKKRARPIGWREAPLRMIHHIA